MPDITQWLQFDRLFLFWLLPPPPFVSSQILRSYGFDTSDLLIYSFMLNEKTFPKDYFSYSVVSMKMEDVLFVVCHMINSTREEFYIIATLDIEY